ncbi:unnamed protein product, partial [Ectocarpus sp. 8 AP-2014]
DHLTRTQPEISKQYRDRPRRREKIPGNFPEVFNLEISQGIYHHISVVPGTAEGRTAEKRNSAFRRKSIVILRDRRKSITKKRSKYREPPKKRSSSAFLRVTPSYTKTQSIGEAA